MEKRLSVILPVYNAERYISKCLDSILGQSFQDFELIIINDGSSDRSQSILEKYQSRYAEHIKLISQPNSGVARARNLGIQLAQGEYITFIDNDDTIKPDFLEKLISETENSHPDIVAGGYERVDGQGKLLSKCVLGDHNNDGHAWALWRVMAPWAKLFRREFIQQKHIQFYPTRMGEDNFFNVLAYLQCSSYSTLAYSGYQYFINTNSVSNASQVGFRPDVTPLPMLKSLYDEVQKLGLDLEKQKYFEYFFLYYSIWYLFFRGKGSRSKIIVDEYHKIFGFIGDLFPNYCRNPLIHPGKPAGEIWSIRLLIWGFMQIRRIGLAPLFWRLYGLL